MPPAPRLAHCPPLPGVQGAIAPQPSGQRSGFPVRQAGDEGPGLLQPPHPPCARLVPGWPRSVRFRALTCGGQVQGSSQAAL